MTSGAGWDDTTVKLNQPESGIRLKSEMELLGGLGTCYWEVDA